MNTTQIKCFLAVAHTLNFTKAAEQLFISQPGLSRQIVSLERELNTLLFIRDKHQVKLTPAAAVLVKELEGFNDRYEEIIHKVQKVGQGFAGTLIIGMLGGQYVNEEITDKLMKFMADNPNIDIIIKQGSFGDLRSWLETGDIDIAITLSFDIKNMKDVRSIDYLPDPSVLAVSKHTRLGKKKEIKMSDLNGETMIFISPDDSPAGCELAKAFVRSNSLHFADVRYAPNLATVMIWIEAGQGIGFINHSSSIVHKSSIRLLDEVVSGSSQGSSLCFAWKTDNYNPAIPMWVNER